MNWEKFGIAPHAFQKSQFSISFMNSNWEKSGSIQRPRPIFQNPSFASMDELWKVMS